jgi:DNA-binding LacI/PurR family transcriptional regulator
MDGRLGVFIVAVTLVQIAKRVGLSPATVSLALRNKNVGKKQFSSKTISKIHRMAKEMGYRPNGMATSLVSNKSNAIGVLISSLSFGSESLLDGIKKELVSDYSALLCVYNSDGKNERNKLDLLMRQRVGGVIAAFSGDPESIPVYHELGEKYDMSIVLIDRAIPGLNLPVVRYDHFASTYQGTKALLGLGHKRIRYASVSMAKLLESTQLRVAGYIKAMQEAGLGDEIRVTEEMSYKEWTREERIKLIASKILDIWRKDNGVTALFVDNDWLAYEILDECGRQNIRVPEDISILGIGNYHFSSLSYVGLSSVVSQQQKFMGAAAGKLLMDLMDGKPWDGKPIILPIEVKLRKTTRVV